MKYLLAITVVLLSISCTHEKTMTKPKTSKSRALPAALTAEPEKPEEFPVDTIDKLRDTTYTFRNYKLSVKEIDSTYIPSLYMDENTRAEIYKKHDNFYEADKEVEGYLAKGQAMYFNRKDSILTLSLEGGKTKTIKDVSKDSEEDIWYTYQNYFKGINSYLLRGQLYEGDCYMVVNRKTGEEIYVIGKIYPSPDNHSFIAINADLEARYSSNGLQLVELSQGQYRPKLTIEGGNWGPVELQWLDNKSFVIKVLEMTENSNGNYRSRFFRMSFK
ncbi:hypothetical protein [Desertivirga arenae]|uniref:hypothetical protein n=1 Tax=Desertivirga arenae TaxID=2810309 RepID=UPI001A959AA6|nr:hypothetical protein [Pedobacter sp. SYSU D00823]